MNGNKARPHPSVEQIIAFNRKQYSASIDGPGIPIEKEDEPLKSPIMHRLKPFTEETIDTIIETGGDGSFAHYDDGVCEGEYVRPTQQEIIEHNRKPCRDFISLSNYTEKMTLVSENLLEKLKDFNYWKEWKNK